MKFDVVLSNPPFHVQRRGWEKYTSKHMRLLDNGSHYALICPADTTNERILDRCEFLDTLKVKRIDHFTGLDYLDTDVYYYIWKK